MATVFDLEQAMALLELEPPFDKRDVQLARRRMAKRWHPDIAPPGKPARARAPPEGDQRGGRPARAPRRGLARREGLAQRGQASAAAARKARAEEGRRAYEAEQRARAAAQERTRHDPFGSRVPDHSVVHRYARCLSYPEWGVGSVTGIYFTGDGDDVQQWARVQFSQGVRTVPAGSLQFVDFSKPDPGRRPRPALHDRRPARARRGDYALAAQRLIYARDAEPNNVPVLRMMTLAFWQAGNLNAAARAVRDWARVDGDRPAAHRFAARIYEDMGAIDLAAEAAERAARAPRDAGAWERLGRLRLRLMDRGGAIEALGARAQPRAERRGAARSGTRAAARRGPRR